jgi:flagellar hook protein FlgE
MSLYGSLASGVSGLNSQATSISINADNISNINTIGYKQGTVDFSTLVTAASSSTTYASGGVSSTNRQTLDKQGLVQGTGNETDIAISGSGFFVVNSNATGTGSTYYTRAGSYRKDATGNFVNAAGYTLMAWPLDNEARLPGQPGNLDTAPNALLTSLKPVNSNSVTGSASATTQVSLGINLQQSQKIQQGPGSAINFPTTAAANYNISAQDVIGPDNSGANILNIGDQIQLTPSTPGTTNTYTYGGLVEGLDITTNILGAATSTTTFNTGVLPAGSTFTIAVPAGSSTPLTFTFTPNSPSSASGQFNNLANLAQAINQTTTLTARINAAGTQIMVAPRDATQSMNIADVSGTLVANVFGANPTATAAAPNRFATLQGFADLVNASPGLGATVDNPLQNTSVSFYATNPLGTITATAIGSTVGAVTSTATSIFAELGIPFAAPWTSSPAYDPTGTNAPNIAGGAINAHFSRNVQIFDAFGTGHNFNVSFLKTAINTWSVEIYSSEPLEIVSSRTDGQIASGTLQFNGDGSLRSVSQTLTAPINILWASQAAPSAINFNWGTAGQMAGTVGAVSIGQTNGLRQLNGNYTVDSVNQNGIATGLLSGVVIDTNGYVIANFSNGTSRKIFQIPIANFSNPNGLQSHKGNAYAETTGSGNFNLFVPNTGGVGGVSPASLEQSNVELSNELTNMIVAQRGYQASSKVIKTVNDMLEDLNRALS